VRASYTLADLRSKRRRSPAENRLLAEHGAAARVFELQGDLRFATLEPVLRDVVESQPQLVVLDFKRVGHVDVGGTRMLANLASRCAALGQQLVLSRVRRGELADLDNQLAPQAISVVHFQPALDAALEWCERRLLARPAAGAAAAGVLALDQHRLCDGMSPAQVAVLQAQLRHGQHEAGTLIVRRGDAADALFLLASGEVSVVLPLPGGGHKRLSTLSAGMAFGEGALLGSGQRTADVRADTVKVPSASTRCTPSTAAAADSWFVVTVERARNERTSDCMTTPSPGRRSIAETLASARPRPRPVSTITRPPTRATSVPNRAKRARCRRTSRRENHMSASGLRRMFPTMCRYLTDIVSGFRPPVGA